MPLYVDCPLRASVCNRVFMTSVVRWVNAGTKTGQLQHIPAGVVKYAAGMPLVDSSAHSRQKAATIHARNRRSAESLVERQLLAVVAFLEDILLQVRIRREVNGRERNITKQTRARALVQAQNTEGADDVDGTTRGSALQSCSLTLHLQTNFAVDQSAHVPIAKSTELLHDFERVGEHDLTTTSRTTSEHLPGHGDPACLGVHDTRAHKVVHHELDRFLGRYTDELRAQSPVET
jgi:hypothetical protein